MPPTEPERLERGQIVKMSSNKLTKIQLYTNDRSAEVHSHNGDYQVVTFTPLTAEEYAKNMPYNIKTLILTDCSKN